MLLIVEPLDPAVMTWLVTRHAVRYAPDLARDPQAFRAALREVQALIIPPAVALDADALALAPRLKAVGRLSAGAENIDFAACSRAGVTVVRPGDATAPAEAEFVVGALLQMLRRVPVVNAEGLRVGRELGAATVGLLGMTSAAPALACLLAVFGAEVIGYDPTLHANDTSWARWQVEPVGLRELMARSDGLCVMLSDFTRYRGLLGERYLAQCKPDQVLVCLSSTGLFDDEALADVLGSGRMASAWFDCLEPGLLAPGRPLHGIETLQVTPRVASTTRESRLRAAWEVARRIDELLVPAAEASGY